MVTKPEVPRVVFGPRSQILGGIVFAGCAPDVGILVEAVVFLVFCVAVATASFAGLIIITTPFWVCLAVATTSFIGFMIITTPFRVHVAVPAASFLCVAVARVIVLGSIVAVDVAAMRNRVRALRSVYTTISV